MQNRRVQIEHRFDIGDRIVVRDAQGAWLAGRPQPPNLPRTVRAVQVNGAAVAFVELSVGPAPEGLDARFLQRQSTSLLLTALATIIVTVLATGALPAAYGAAGVEVFHKGQRWQGSCTTAPLPPNLMETTNRSPLLPSWVTAVHTIRDGCGSQ